MTNENEFKHTQEPHEPTSTEQLQELVRRHDAGDDITFEANMLLLELKEFRMKRFQYGGDITEQQFKAEQSMLDELELLIHGI